MQYESLFYIKMQYKKPILYRKCNIKSLFYIENTI
jgi:hypothetical protein